MRLCRFPGCIAVAEEGSDYCAVDRAVSRHPEVDPAIARDIDFALERDADGLPIRLWMGTQKPETK